VARRAPFLIAAWGLCFRLATETPPSPLLVNLGAGDGGRARFRGGWEQRALGRRGRSSADADGARYELPFTLAADAAEARLRGLAGAPTDVTLLAEGRVVARKRRRAVARGHRAAGAARSARAALPLSTAPEPDGELGGWTGQGVSGLWPTAPAGRAAARCWACRRWRAWRCAGRAVLWSGVFMWRWPPPPCGSTASAAWWPWAAGPGLAGVRAALGVWLARVWGEHLQPWAAAVAPAAALAWSRWSHWTTLLPLPRRGHARFVRAIRQDGLLLLDPAPYQLRSGAWTRSGRPPHRVSVRPLFRRGRRWPRVGRGAGREALAALVGCRPPGACSRALDLRRPRRAWPSAAGRAAGDVVASLALYPLLVGWRLCCSRTWCGG
jgi:hypothetical protein